MPAVREPRRQPRRPRTRRSVLVAALAALSVSLPAAPAAADDPPFVGWTAALPALAWQYQPTSEDDCVAGRTPCVRKTIREMERRLEPLVERCAHSAVFAHAYLRTTERYLETSLTEGFYVDPAFVNHQDVVFARMYLDASDDWSAGRLDEVPPAWRTAFRAAERSEVSGTGDLLLGMNAHVNRDLPFALAAIGLVAPDGSSRKIDHDTVDRMLNSVVDPLLEEQSARFDPTMRAPQTPYGVGYTALMQLLQAWRESAWRQAEQLAAAPDEATRAAVAEAIERGAAAQAELIVAATRYVPPLTSTADRDRYCAVHAGTSP